MTVTNPPPYAAWREISLKNTRADDNKKKEFLLCLFSGNNSDTWRSTWRDCHCNNFTTLIPITLPQQAFAACVSAKPRHLYSTCSTIIITFTSHYSLVVIANQNEVLACYLDDQPITRSPFSRISGILSRQGFAVFRTCFDTATAAYTVTAKNSSFFSPCIRQLQLKR